MPYRLSLKVVLQDGTEIKTMDEFDNELDASEQMTVYGIRGYYSISRKTYYPPSSIKMIQLINKDENKP